MNVPSTIGRIAAVLATVSALTALAGVAHAGTSRPTSMSKAEYRALMLRSEALNQKYGLGKQRAVPQGTSTAESRALMLRSEALNRQYQLGSGTSKPAAMGRQEYRALVLRSNALNAKYGLGGARVVASTPPAVTVVENGFVWRDFAIGAATMLGLVLVATAVFASTRSTPRTRVSS